MIFAQHHDEADTLIEEMIQRHSAPKQLTVVSSDLRLQTAANRRKAVAVDSENWLDGLNPQKHGISGDNNSPAIQKDTQGLENIDWAAEFEIDVETSSNQEIPFKDDFGEL